MGKASKRRQTVEEVLLRLRKKVHSEDRWAFDFIVDYARARCEGKYTRLTLKLLRTIQCSEYPNYSWAAERLREMPLRRAERRVEITDFGFEECGFDEAGHVFKDACRCAIAQYLGALEYDTFPFWLLTIALGIFYGVACPDDFDTWSRFVS